ncbi:MAG: YceI family protein [Candidatus Didemnitutus sp.]|nr:YceI family protein [Candidatus Didemnitutus sp.]
MGATAEGDLEARGLLTLRGVTREIRFPVWLAQDAGVIAIDGDALLDVRVFGLPVPRLYWVLKVDPWVRVRLHLQGTVAS